MQTPGHTENHKLRPVMHETVPQTPHPSVSFLYFILRLNMCAQWLMSPVCLSFTPVTCCFKGGLVLDWALGFLGFCNVLSKLLRCAHILC